MASTECSEITVGDSCSGCAAPIKTINLSFGAVAHRKSAPVLRNGSSHYFSLSLGL